MNHRRGRPLRILLSAGPTREPLDAVRFISNYSTGAMASALAAQALRRGHRVTVVSGPLVERLPAGARVVAVERAAQMGAAMRRLAPRADAVVMAAAVADFQPVRAPAGKLRRAATATVRLRATPDIVAGLPGRARQVRVGFALESGAVVAAARRKLRAKRLDLVVAQALRGPSGEAPFGRQRVRAWLLERGGAVQSLGTVSKPALARRLVARIETLWRGSQVVRRGSAKPLYAGSIPARASSL